MSELLPGGPLLAAFVVASTVLAVTPGPGVLYIVARSLSQGRRSGLASVAGVGLGNLGNAIGASLGLGALFALSSVAFSVVRYAGAAYLLWLGVRALRAARAAAFEPVPVAADREPLSRAFVDGFWVALLNPKTALFFAAFLPQFLSPAGSPALQSACLGAVFVSIAALTDATYALAAGALAPALGRVRAARTLGRYGSAGAFLGLGLYTALGGPRDRG